MGHTNNSNIKRVAFLLIISLIGPTIPCVIALDPIAMPFVVVCTVIIIIHIYERNSFVVGWFHTKSHLKPPNNGSSQLRCLFVNIVGAIM
jgi:hypothetical protein